MELWLTAVFGYKGPLLTEQQRTEEVIRAAGRSCGGGGGMGGGGGGGEEEEEDQLSRLNQQLKSRLHSVRRRLSVQLPILHHSYLPVIGGVSCSSSSLFVHHDALVTAVTSYPPELCHC
ncbi:hypothetical protein INR49_008002 [Caranx melampygus]|nr:hypothetical protein INR49_008002 [Caranx melampygus]